MLTKFTSPDCKQQFEIFNFDSPKPGDDKSCVALVNDNQLVVMKMADVSNDVQCEDLSLLNLCPGLLETEVLPLISSSQIKSEIYSLVFIERCSQHIVYR